MNGKKSEIVQLISTTKWVLGLYFKNYPGLTTLYMFTQIVLQVGNLFNAYIIAVVTDLAIGLVSNTKNLGMNDFIPVIAIILGANFVLEVVRVINNYSIRMINFQDWMRLRKVLYEKLYSLGVSKLENSEIANKSQRFSEEIQSITGYLEMLVGIIGNFAGFVSATLVLLTRIPEVTVVFGLAVLIQWLINQKFIREIWILSRDTTEDRRKSITTANLLADPASLKELIITKGQKYLSDKFEKYVQFVTQKMSHIRSRWAMWNIAGEIIDAAGFGYGILLVFKRLVSRIITVGQLTFEIRSLRIFSDSFGSLANNLVGIREFAIRLGDARELFSNFVPDLDGEKILGGGIMPVEINIDRVNFAYPESKRNVVDNLSLTIKPGEKVAIVGENGAGKTTLVKLICRLYRVDSGEIKLGGLNINKLKILSWYRRLGVLFQDFNTYSHLSVKENIEIGDSTKIANEDELWKALEKANGAEFVKDYPLGLGQILSERYKGGIRPSTGQWQKIAIARFFYRDAPVLILDEPTASIDAVAEAQIFDNIYKFIKNKTVIIISHRFATVRNADRIIVLDKGRIVEDGNHDELLKKDGKYAQAFKLQARGYQ